MVNNFEKVLLEEAKIYLRKSKELEQKIEEYHKTYDDRSSLSIDILNLSKKMLELQGAFNYYLRSLKGKYGFKEISLVESLDPYLSAIYGATRIEQYGYKNLYTKNGNSVNAVTIIGDADIIGLDSEKIYSQEQLRDIIAKIKNRGKSIVLGMIYDADALSGFNKLKLNMVGKDGRIMYALTKDDELGEVVQNFEDYLNRNNRQIDDIPNDIIVQNIEARNFGRIREI